MTDQTTVSGSDAGRQDEQPQDHLAEGGRTPVHGFTPPPWTARMQMSKAGDNLGWIIEHSNGRIGWASLAYADTNQAADENDPANIGNALLMAAAPDFYQAATQFLASVKDGDVTKLIDYYADIFGEAVAKATGATT